MPTRLLCLLTAFVCTTSFGQSHDLRHRIRDTVDRILHQHEIVFDSNGRVMVFPTQVVRRNQTVCFKVRVPVSYLKSEWDKFKSNLSATSQYLINPSQSLAIPYNCLLTGKASGPMTPYYGRLNAISSGKYDFICPLDAPQQIPDPGDDSAINIPFHILKDNILHHQYEVRVFQEGNYLRTIPLTAPESINCSDSCIYFQGPCLHLTDVVCGSCANGVTFPLEFRLVWHDPWAQTSVDWYNKLGKSGFTAENVDSPIVRIARAATVGTPPTKIDPADTAVFNQSVSSLTTTAGLQNWFLGWLWYTKGKLTLDPFAQLTTQKKKSVTADIKVMNRVLTKLRDEKKFVDSAKAKLRAANYNIRTFQELEYRSDSLATAIETDSTIADSLQQIISKSQSMPTTLTKAAVMNSLQIAVSKGGNIKPQKQFDAYASYQPIYKNSSQLDRVTEVPENEIVQIAIYNVDSSKQIKINEKRQDFNDLEEFTKLIQEQLKGDSLSSLSTAALTTVEQFAQSFIAIPGFGASDECSPIITQKLLSSIAADINAGLITFPPDISLLSKPASLSAPRYTTFLKPITRYEAPNRDSISIREIAKKDTANVQTTFVKIGKLRFLQLAAGIAVTQQPVSSTTIDTTGGGFKVSTSDNRATPILGFKLYPIRNYNRDSRILPRYPLRRFSLFAGFELLHPLNNFYVGGCYDIVPGLGFSVGSNWYLQTHYKVVSNVIIGTSRAYQNSGAYYAITVNPTLFVQFIKLLIK